MHTHDNMIAQCILLLACVGCSEIEEKVDQMAAELTKRQLERKDTALQYKRYLLGWV